MRPRVAIVTDSTASIPIGVAEKLRIAVIQLELKVGEEYNDERRVPHPQLAQAMRDDVPVATAPPPPPAFFWNYMDAVSAGAEEIISVHLSEGLSQTCEAARIAATEVDVPVHVVDSRLCGLGLGYPVIAAAEAAAAGAAVQDVLGILDRRLRGTTEILYVDTLEYLKRSGRIGRAQAMFGQTLSVKPVLGFHEGELAPLAKGIGADRALGKAITAAVEHAGNGPVDIATEHFQAEERAGQVLHRLQDRLPLSRQPILEETSAIIGAHTGPGALGIAISPV